MSLDSVPPGDQVVAGTSAAADTTAAADLSRDVFVRVSPEEAIVRVREAREVFVFVELDPDHRALFTVSKKEALVRFEYRTAAWRERFPNKHETPCTVGLMISPDGTVCIGTQT